MSYPNAIEVCHAELFTKEIELRERYPQALVHKLLRVREMYNWFIANPDGTDREFVAELCLYYAEHRNKTMVYYFDATGLSSNNAVNDQDFRWWVVHEFERHG